MPKPIVRIYTDVNEFIDREMNAAEYAIYERDLKQDKKQQAEAEAKETAKQAILDRIGLTADELQTIPG